MPANLPIWIGAKGLTETPDSPEQIQDAVKTTVNRKYEGPFGVCQAAQPTIGQTFSDLPGDVVVVGSRCIKMPGGKGQLLINLETPYATTFETEWVEVDKALILNPRYWDGSTPDLTPAGSFPLDLTDKSMIENWEQEGNPSLKGQYQFKTSVEVTSIGGAPFSVAMPTNTAPVHYSNYQGFFNIYTLSASAQDYAKKRLKGEEIYRVYAPVVRQTSESLSKPVVGSGGVIENPPPDSNPPNNDFTSQPYMWQRSAQRVSRTGPYGKYRLQLEWQGADRIDTDIYGQSSDGTAPNPP